MKRIGLGFRSGVLRHGFSFMRNACPVVLILLPFPGLARAGDLVDVPFELHRPGAQAVHVAGEFNGWNASDTPLTDDGNGVWKVTKGLPVGEYGYKFIVDGEWILDPNNNRTKVVGGAENSLLVVEQPVVEQKEPSLRTWTSTKGQQVQATFQRREGNMIWLVKPDSKQVQIPLDMLVAEDREYVAALSASSGLPAAVPVAAPASSGPLMLGGRTVGKGVLERFSVPIPKNVWDQGKRFAQDTGESLGSWPQDEKISVGVLLPEGFDPGRDWPVLVVNAPSKFMNVDHLECCFMAAAAAGYIAVAGDGPGNRWVKMGAALAFLHEHWPQSRSWKLAFGGFSGGAKASGLAGAMASKAGYSVIGMWMGGCNQDFATVGFTQYKPRKSAFMNVPVYLASGTVDDIATPRHHEAVVRSLRHSGFSCVRLVFYEGGHHPVPQDKVKEGLEWFLEVQDPAARKKWE